MHPPAVGHSRNAMWTESLFNGLESTGVQRRLWSKSLVQIPKACLGTSTSRPRAFPVGETGVVALSQKVIIVNQPGASGSIGRWPPRRLRQINTRLIDVRRRGGTERSSGLRQSLVVIRTRRGDDVDRPVAACPAARSGGFRCAEGRTVARSYPDRDSDRSETPHSA
jgi:hypothetical protein